MQRCNFSPNSLFLQYPSANAFPPWWPFVPYCILPCQDIPAILHFMPSDVLHFRHYYLYPYFILNCLLIFAILHFYLLLNFWCAAFPPLTFFPTAFCRFRIFLPYCISCLLLHFWCAAFPPLWPFSVLHSALLVYFYHTVFIHFASFLICCISAIMNFFYYCFLPPCLFISALLPSFLAASFLIYWIYFCYTTFIPSCFISDVLHLRHYDLF